MSKLLRFAVPVLAVSLLLAFAISQRAAVSPTSLPQPAPEDEQSFRILLGLTDVRSTPWDGSLTVSSGTVARLEPWRSDLADRLEEPTGNSVKWKLATHPARAFGGQNAQQQPVVANGVIATLRNLNSSSEVSIETAQGKFQFRPSEFKYGTATKFLDGKAMVERVPASNAITRSREEQDFPAAATDRAGNVWVAYQQFTIHPKFTGFRQARIAIPDNVADLAEPTHGDQVMLVKYTRGTWSQPIAVSDAKGDLFKPAVAVDGQNRVWVFWSSNVKNNFDLNARVIENGTPGKTLKLSSDAGPDIQAVATTDAKGRVWVAWQAFRNGRSQIRAAYQTGDKFSPEIIVSATSGNEWNPAIAAAANGEIAIAWDSYRRGDYDIYARTFDANAKSGAERTIAATNRYEAYPSLAYDKDNGLWTAWEESDNNWGKDFGADETTGIGLYHGRWVRVKVWHGDKALTPPDPGAVMPGAVRRKVDDPSRQSDPPRGSQPNPDLAKNRANNQTPAAPPRPRNSYPRLLADNSGRVWMAYRAAHPTWWTALGTVWFEYVISFDGQAWTNPIYIHHSDNLLDNKPALASTANGELIVVNSSDGRQQFHPRLQVNQSREDPYNNDLYAARIIISEPFKGMNLTNAPAETASGSLQIDTPNVKRLREYRARIANTEYRIVRGEFHRHTEISMDGGNDGSIWDSFRYAMDAAGLDWVGCCDHDNGFGREYTWWITQKLTDIFHLPGAFTPMFNYERSVAYPEGHRNVIFAERGIRTLPRLPKVDESAPGNAPDTQMLYKYLRQFNGIVASHTSATNMGTDWRDNDPLVEPIVEIYQGDRQNYEMPDAPRSNDATDSIGGWREKGFVSLALAKGYKLGFQASSDHISTHMSYCNLFVKEPTRKGILEAFQKRHIYGATDDILADVRSGQYMMGDQFETTTLPRITVKLTGTTAFAKVVIVKDNQYVYATEPKTATVNFTWRDEKAARGKQSYYYVRGEQQDGEIVWASPMWITYQGK
ncbi:MAG TPA: hypothetical protein VFZ34_28100 [Blastocatellia bacterium]|nr:hypothetical protein [Blastocatellia bacterium]